MIYIGNHVSSGGGFRKMGEHELSLGGDTFAFFTRNPRGGASKPADPEDAAALRKMMEEKHFGPLVAHAPYTLNACSAKDYVVDFARNTLADDLKRMQYVPGNYYNFHPGAHLGQGAERGAAMIADAINYAVRECSRAAADGEVPAGTESSENLSEDTGSTQICTTILLETMAGKGSEVGRTFEELAAIIAQVDHPELMGVTLDTCHVWDAGYDIAGDLDGVLRHFDEVIGLDRLRAIHLNDSRNPRGAHKDRHEKLGQGCIGEDALRAVVQHPLLQHLPFILETPNEDPGYRREIALVRSWMV